MISGIFIRFLFSFSAFWVEYVFFERMDSERAFAFPERIE